MATIHMSSSKGGPFMGILFLLIGVGVSVWGFLEMKNAKASSSWPVVEGSVNVSKVERSVRRSSSSSGRSRRSKTEYVADIRYSYTYKGKSYSAKRVAFGGSSKGSQHTAQAMVSRYPVGKKVKVYVNPTKPELACLEPGSSMKSYLPLGIGVVFAVAGLAMSIGGFLGKGNAGAVQDI